MYNYEPKLKKTREKLTLLILGFTVALLFAYAALPNSPFPALLQLVGMAWLVLAVMIACKCLLCRYAYTVAPREYAEADEPYDFTVTEIQGKRRAVVCRISLAEVESVEQVNNENRKQITQALKGNSVYRYIAQLSLDNTYLVTVRDGDRHFYLFILADQTLLSLLNSMI